MQNVVPKLSKTPGRIQRPDPALGQHNEEVFKELLGFDDARIKELTDAGIV